MPTKKINSIEYASNYKEVIKQLTEINLNEEFQIIFEKYLSKDLQKMIRKAEFIHKNTTASILNILLDKIRKSEGENSNYEKWLKVFHYYMRPPFDRSLNQLK